MTSVEPLTGVTRQCPIRYRTSSQRLFTEGDGEAEKCNGRPSRCFIARCFIAIALVGVGACASDEASLSGTDGPVMRHTGPYWDDAMLESVGGILALEGDCLYLDRAEWGQRYPVIWPAGTAWDEEKQVVVPPAGGPLGIGQSVDGDGGYMASGAVEGFAGPRARELAERCLDEVSDQVAVVNNSPTAISASGP